MTNDDTAAMANAMADADAMFQAHGREVPRPAYGETVAQYQHRMAIMMKPHSVRWRDNPLAVSAGSPAFAVVYQQIREDAIQEGKHPTNIPAGQLVERTEVDRAGRQHTIFFGSPRTWMQAWMGDVRRVLRIHNRPHEAPRQGL